MFRSLLSHVDVEGELESPVMSQGEPLPRPFLHHHSQCLLYRGLSGDETHPLAATLEVLAFGSAGCEYLIVFLENVLIFVLVLTDKTSFLM